MTYLPAIIICLVTYLVRLTIVTWTFLKFYKFDNGVLCLVDIIKEHYIAGFYNSSVCFKVLHFL